MDKRAELVLELIVEHYAKTAEPVGSRVLTKLIEVKISAATIRNIMSDLSEMGMIVQPHISAGRIPTDLGYRYYINRILNNTEPSTAGFTAVDQKSESHVQRLEDILLEISGDLSKATNCTSIIISPQPAVSKLKTIELIKLGEKQLLIVLITQIGMVRNKIIHLRECPNQEMLDKIKELLCGLFIGRTILDIRNSLVETISGSTDQYDETIIQAIRIGKKAFSIDIENDVFILGRSKMCAFPEFSDQERLKIVFNVLDDKKVLFDTLVSVMNQDGIQVRIGNENSYDGLNQCSVITGTYGSSDYLLGSLGIIGPTRMDYPKIISEIDYSTQKLSYVLTQFLG
ncbi:MAG: heat-inducible transcription repressor HrcA [SAR324 cluster bacterium]|nr:heat-inducible transcription repressor HrcA [SAR324 cluster bacterium]